MIIIGNFQTKIVVVVHLVEGERERKSFLGNLVAEMK